MNRLSESHMGYITTAGLYTMTVSRCGQEGLWMWVYVCVGAVLCVSTRGEGCVSISPGNECRHGTTS